jgi:hypothetical protein
MRGVFFFFAYNPTLNKGTYANNHLSQIMKPTRLNANDGLVGFGGYDCLRKAKKSSFFRQWLLIGILSACSIMYLQGQNHSSFTYHIKAKEYQEILSKVVTDKDGFAWYVTEKGLVKDYGNSQILIPLETGRPYAKEPIWSLTIDKKGYIWFNCFKGTFRVNPKTLQHILFPYDFSTEKNPVFSKLFPGDNHDLWVPTSKGFFFRFTSDSIPKQEKIFVPTQIKSTPLPQANELPNFVIYNRKVYRIRDHTLELIRILNHYMCLGAAITQDQAQKISLPPGQGGFYKYQNHKYPYYYVPELNRYLIKFYNNHQIHLRTKTADFADVILFKVLDHEIEFLDFKRNPDGELHLKVSRKIKHPYNSNHVSFDHSKSIIYTANKSSITKVKLSPQVYSYFHPDDKLRINTRRLQIQNNHLYISSFYGVNKYPLPRDDAAYAPLITHASKTNQKEHDSLIIANSFPYIAKMDPVTRGFKPIGEKLGHYTFTRPKGKGQSWVGSNEGLYVLDHTSNQVRKWRSNAPHSIPLGQEVIYAVLASTLNDNLYVGTTNGLYVFNQKQQGSEHYALNHQENKALNHAVEDLYETPNGTIWMATTGGLAQLEPNGSLKIFTEKEGLPDNHVHCILPNNNHLWLSTDNGLSRMDIDSLKFDNLFVSETAAKNVFNYNSALKVSNELLLFGSSNGVVEIRPKLFRPEPNISKIIPVKHLGFKDNSLERINTPGSLEKLSELQLNYNNNSFSLEFAIQNAYNHNKHRFLYKIDGLMPDWRDIGNDNMVNIFELPTGQHVLEVMAYNEHGQPTANIYTVTIKVAEVFYKRLWFRILGLTFLTLIIYFIVFLSFRRKKERLEAIGTIKKLEIGALTAQMTPHFIFNTINGIQNVLLLKGELAANRYITNFAKLMRSTMQISRDYYLSVEEEVNYLEAYIKLQQYRNNHGFDYNIDCCENAMAANFRIPGLLIQPIVENAIIHGLNPKPENGFLNITFQMQGRRLSVKIADNGIGRKKSMALQKERDYKSYSTEVIQRRIELGKQIGDLDISFSIADKDKGTEFPGTLVEFIITPLK